MRTLLLCALLLCVTACLPQPLSSQPVSSTVKGDVTYRERMALPENATLWVQLIQTDPLGRTLMILDEYETRTKGQVPVPFSLAYDSGNVQDGAQYALLARLLYQDQTLFANPEPVRLSLPASMDQHLVLARTIAPENTGYHTPTARELTGKRWELRTLYGADVERFEGEPLPGLSVSPEDHRINGHDGCNSFSAPFAQNGDKLDIGLAASTMKMCFNGMDQARALTTAIHEADNWLSNGKKLELRHADRVVATFDGVAL